MTGPVEGEGASRPAIIYHIADGADWAEALDIGTYRGGPLCRKDGFIHCSTADQLAGTLGRFFQGRGDLVLLEIRTSDLGDWLKWETVPGVATFPHIYAALPVGRARCAGPIRLGEDGQHVLPPLGQGSA